MPETTSLLESYRALVAEDQPEQLQDFLDNLQPYDISRMLERLEHGEQLDLLRHLPPAIAAEALEYLEYDHQYKLLDHLDAETASKVLAAMSSDASADLALAVHPRQAERLLSLLPDEHRQAIRRLMEYPEGSTGSRMTVDYIAVRQHWPAWRVLEHFRKVGRDTESVSYVYVLDSSGLLTGVASLRDLLLAAPDTPVSEIMIRKVVSVPATADQELGARLLRQYDFLALPVVDERGRMVGIMTADDVFEVLDFETTEDFQRISAVSPVEIDYSRASVGKLWRTRISWLLVLLIADFLSSSVLAHFEATIQAMVALTFFIPMLIDSGGNVGTQSATLIIRGLSTGEIDLRDWLRVLGKELLVGLLLGVTLGVIVYLRGFFWRGGPEVGLIVGLTMVALVVWANLIGAMLPMILSRLRMDPAVVSSPFITTAVDVTGLIIYFSVARWLLD